MRKVGTDTRSLKVGLPMTSSPIYTLATTLPTYRYKVTMSSTISYIGSRRHVSKEKDTWPFPMSGLQEQRTGTCSIAGILSHGRWRTDSSSLTLNDEFNGSART